MTAVSSIVYTSPCLKNDGFGLVPVSLSISFEGRAMQSALHNSIVCAHFYFHATSNLSASPYRSQFSYQVNLEGK